MRAKLALWMLLPLVFASTACSLPANRQVEPPPHPDLDHAFRNTIEYRALVTAERLDGNAIYFEGNMPLTTRSLRHVIARDDAREFLLDLFEHATLPGKLYALAGLYDVDHSAYEQLVLEVISLDEQVRSISGCVGSSYTPAELLLQFEPPDEPGMWCFRQGIIQPFEVFGEHWSLEQHRAMLRAAPTLLRSWWWKPEESRTGNRAAKRLGFLGPEAPDLAFDIAREALRSDTEWGPYTGRELLVAVAPWLGHRLDDLIELVNGRGPAERLGSVVTSPDIWRFAPESVLWSRFLKLGLTDPDLAEDVQDVIRHTLLERPSFEIEDVVHRIEESGRAHDDEARQPLERILHDPRAWRGVGLDRMQALIARIPVDLELMVGEFRYADTPGSALLLRMFQGFE